MKDLEQKSVAELRKLLAEKREALRDFRFSMKGSRTRDTQLGNNLRKEIARIMTQLTKSVSVTETA